MNRVGIYAGSFDPFTLGHLDLARRASYLVDKLIIAIGEHPTKQPLFDAAKRSDGIELSLSQAELSPSSTWEVKVFNGLLVNFADEVGAKVIIRGLRHSTDFVEDFSLAGMNREIAPDIETIFLAARPEFSAINATLVRQIILMGGDASAFLPRAVQSSLASPK